MGRKRKRQAEAAPPADVQVIGRPDIKMLDECGFETMAFECWGCRRTDHRSANFVEAYQRNGKKLFCIACGRPDMFEWKVEKLEDGTRREYIRPLTHREMYNKISPEARKLAEKQALLQTLRQRAEGIQKLVAQLEYEYLGLMDAIPQAELDVADMQRIVSAIEHDQVAKKVQDLSTLTARVMQLTKEIDAAKKMAADQDKVSQATGGVDVAEDAT